MGGKVKAHEACILDNRRSLVTRAGSPQPFARNIKLNGRFAIILILFQTIKLFHGIDTFRKNAFFQ